MKKAGAVLTLVVILVLPLVAYVILRQGDHQMKTISHLGPMIKNPDGSPDSVYHKVGPFSFQNQAGNSITSDSIEGKVVIAGLFFTAGPTLSPKTARSFVRLQEEFSDDPGVRLMMISVNPEKDSVPVLADFGKAYMAIPGKWDLVTGPAKEVEDFVHDQLFLQLFKGKGGEMGYNYSTNLRIIDQEGELRGSWDYEGAEVNAMDTLIAHVRLLEIEHARKRR